MNRRRCYEAVRLTPLDTYRGLRRKAERLIATFHPQTNFAIAAALRIVAPRERLKGADLHHDDDAAATGRLLGRLNSVAFHRAPIALRPPIRHKILEGVSSVRLPDLV